MKTFSKFKPHFCKAFPSSAVSWPASSHDACQNHKPCAQGLGRCPRRQHGAQRRNGRRSRDTQSPTQRWKNAHWHMNPRANSSSATYTRVRVGCERARRRTSVLSLETGRLLKVSTNRHRQRTRGKSIRGRNNNRRPGRGSERNLGVRPHNARQRMNELQDFVNLRRAGHRGDEAPTTRSTWRHIMSTVPADAPPMQ